MVTIPVSKQFTCTVKWKEWMRVSSHICQQVPWQWYEISIVIFFFYCHYPRLLRGNYTRHQTTEVWWNLEKLNTEKNWDLWFQEFTSSVRDASFDKILRVSNWKMCFYKDQGNIESSWVYAELTGQITTRLPIHSTTTSRQNLPHRTNFKKIPIGYFVIEFKLLLQKYREM